jgi:hypothetical protein
MTHSWYAVHQVMTLTFIWPITNGLLDALERIEGSAQRVLSTQHNSQQRNKPQQQQQQQGWLAGLQAWRREHKQWLQPLLALLAIRPGLQAVRQALCKDLPHALSSKQGVESLTNTFTNDLCLRLSRGCNES